MKTDYIGWGFTVGIILAFLAGDHVIALAAAALLGAHWITGAINDYDRHRREEWATTTGLTMTGGGPSEPA